MQKHQNTEQILTPFFMMLNMTKDQRGVTQSHSSESRHKDFSKARISLTVHSWSRILGCGAQNSGQKIKLGLGKLICHSIS